MQFTYEEITKIFNQAIENESGAEGADMSGWFSFSRYEVTHDSDSQKTFLKLFEVAIPFEEGEDQITFVNEDLQNPNWKYFFC